jgi:sigma-B regulation protein RsbQ
MWRLVVPTLESEFTVVRFDHVGAGRSVSAMMGVLAATREPDLFSGLVLLAPSSCFIDDLTSGYRGGVQRTGHRRASRVAGRELPRWSGAMAPVIMGNPDRPESAEELANSFCRTEPAIARAFACVTFLSDNRADLSKLAVPTLIAQCSRDPIAPPEVGDFMNAQCPAAG